MEYALSLGPELSFIKLSAFDNFAQVALYEGDLDACRKHLAQCAEIISTQRLPARSWYDLAHQLTRCAYFERLEDWSRIIAIVDEADPELARRQFRALRTSLLCAKARALSHLQEPARAEAALAAAVRACPRGAFDPLILLEASKGLCLAKRGDQAGGAMHFGRALAGCRAIGHRYHEHWIDRARTAAIGSSAITLDVRSPERSTTDTALLLSDVAAILGAGHSIDLLSHRMAEILQSTPLASRATFTSESGCEYWPDPSAVAATSPDGAFVLTLRGSDRRVTITVTDVRAIEDITLLKSLADLAHVAVARTTDAENDDEEQNLWPRTTPSGGDDTVFRSPRMTELLRIAARLASADLPILITGETGTGKEIFAKLIHDYSKVSRGPFVPFNCSAIPRELVESQLFGHRKGAFTGAVESFPGVIRAAQNGTLFLDEVGDIDAGIQPKFLRFLESAEVHSVGDLTPQKVQVRVVAATNADLDKMADEGRFRRDLLYRLGVARIDLPPLRERKDEIPALAALFVERYSRECHRTGIRLADDAIAALLMYDWPGNIRQLANEIRRVVAMATDGQTLHSTDLAAELLEAWNARPTQPPADSASTITVRADQTLEQAMSELEERFIERAMSTAGGRVAEAAELLGLSRKGLFLKRQRRGLVKN